MYHRKSLFPIAASVVALPLGLLIAGLGLYWFFNAVSGAFGLTSPVLLNVLLGVVAAIAGVAFLVGVPMALLMVVVEFARNVRHGRSLRTSAF